MYIDRSPQSQDKLTVKVLSSTHEIIIKLVWTSGSFCPILGFCPPSGLLDSFCPVATLHVSMVNEPRHFQQCGILTCVDSDEPVQPPLKMMFGQQLNTHRTFKRLAKALIRLRICAG